MNTRIRTTAAALAVGVLLAGCASSGPIVQAPAVTLSHVEARDLSFDRQLFLLTFRVDNPNRFPLPVRAARYRLQLENQQFAGGETSGRFTVPAGGAGEFSISVELDLVKSATRIASLLATGTSRPLTYELHGSLKVAIPFARALTFSNSGTIVVQGLSF